MPGTDHQPHSGDQQGSSRAASRTVLWLLGLGFALALAWTLRATMMVTLPIAIALLLALAVAPFADWTEAKLPRRLKWFGNVAAVLLIIVFIALFLAGIGFAAQQIASGSQRYIPQAQQQFQQSGLASMLGGGRQLSSALQSVASYAATALNMVWQTAAGVVLILFLVLLMLIERPYWRAKLASMNDDDEKWVRSASIAGMQFRRYFLTRLALGTITSVLYMGWLSLFGIDFILVWGLLALLLNFIPTVGSLIAGIFPVLFAFVQKDPGTAMLVAGGLLLIEQVMGNFVDPRLLGKNISVSPLMILISLLVWSWIWGVPGALIAVPMTILIVVTFAQIPTLRPVALLLSNERALADLAEQLAQRRS